MFFSGHCCNTYCSTRDRTRSVFVAFLIILAVTGPSSRCRSRFNTGSDTGTSTVSFCTTHLHSQCFFQADRRIHSRTFAREEPTSVNEQRSVAEEVSTLLADPRGAYDPCRSWNVDPTDTCEISVHRKSLLAPPFRPGNNSSLRMPWFWDENRLVALHRQFD